MRTVPRSRCRTALWIVNHVQDPACGWTVTGGPPRGGCSRVDDPESTLHHKPGAPLYPKSLTHVTTTCAPQPFATRLRSETRSERIKPRGVSSRLTISNDEPRHGDWRGNGPTMYHPPLFRSTPIDFLPQMGSSSEAFCWGTVLGLCLQVYPGVEPHLVLPFSYFSRLQLQKKTSHIHLTILVCTAKFSYQKAA